MDRKNGSSVAVERGQRDLPSKELGNKELPKATSTPTQVPRVTILNEYSHNDDFYWTHKCGTLF